MNRKRIEWIDIAKGFAILTVIIGHSCWGYVRGIIFSTHIPLFFILSAITYKYSHNTSEFIKNLKRSFFHLILPVLVIFLSLILFNIVDNPSVVSSWAFWEGKLYSLIFASGVKATFDNINIAPIGAPWFLCALFIGRSIFDYLQMKFSRHATLIICIIMSAIGVALGASFWLPMSLDIVFAIMPFFYFGYFLQNRKNNKPENIKTTLLILIISLAIWLFTFYLTSTNKFSAAYLELAIRRYPLFPICYICAIAGTLAVAEISKILSKTGRFSAPLQVLGKNSLCLFILHCVDTVWKDLWYDTNIYLNILKRITVDLFFFTIILLAVKLVLQYFNKNEKFPTSLLYA